MAEGGTNLDIKRYQKKFDNLDARREEITSIIKVTRRSWTILILDVGERVILTFISENGRRECIILTPKEKG